MKIDLDTLLQARKNRAWTQAHLAEVCGLSLRTIQRIEKSGTASHDSVQALASVFNITAEELILKEVSVQQKQTEIKISEILDKFITRLAVVLMLVVPAISFVTSITGTNLKINISDYKESPSYFMSSSPAIQTLPRNAIKGTRTVSSSSSALLLFGYSNITYFTYLPAVLLFCISIGLFRNQKRWVKICLMISSLIFVLSSSKLSFIIFIPFIALFYLMSNFANKWNWQLIH